MYKLNPHNYDIMYDDLCFGMQNIHKCDLIQL